MPRTALASDGDVPLLAGRAFEGLPHGLLVLDGSGTVEVANRAASELLQIGPGAMATCCDLFACRAAEGPLAGVCLTELVPPGGGGHLELRLDLPTGSGWVTAAAMDQHQIVVQVRRSCSSRFVHSDAAAGPELYISALGPLEIEAGGERIVGPWLEQRPGQLLKYLISERHRPASADRIIAALWPHADSRALSRVRYFVHKLRDALEPKRETGQSAYIVGSRRGYALHPARVRLDVDDFEQRIAAGLSAFGRGDTVAATELLSRGLALYRGELLADEPYAVWALAERDRLRDMAARSLRVLFQDLYQRGDLHGADAHIKRLIEFEPYDVNLQRRYVELSLGRGRRGEAQRRYAELRERMLHDFGEDLDFEFSELLEAGGRQLRLT